MARDTEKGVSIGEKIREKYDWCSSFLTVVTSSSSQPTLFYHFHHYIRSQVTFTMEALCCSMPLLRWF